MNKFTKATNLLKEYYPENIHINLSPVHGYRSRVEFGYKNNFYTMYDENKDIKFYRVITQENYVPEELNSFNNLEHILVEDFKKMFNIL